MNQEYSLVYLVDDDADDRMFFKDAFQETFQKPKVITFNCAVRFLEEIQKKLEDLPQIIFLDLNMPKLSGLDCLRQLKVISRIKGIPVAIYTTSNAVKYINDSYKDGATKFVNKPNDFNEIVKTMNVILTMNWVKMKNERNKEDFVLAT